jgi:hypothetical protein
MMQDARMLASDLGVTTRDLTEKELTRFGRSYDRQFLTVYPEREVRDIYRRHEAEALLGAMIAKEQMDAEIDDEQPASNKVGGPLPIEASHLGIGDDWEDLNSIYTAAQNAWTTGAPQNWIHSGTLLMRGVIGNAIRIGKNAVHVVFGIESTHDSPRIEAFQFTIDGKQKPKLTTFWQPRTLPGAPHAVKELDNAYIFKSDTTVLAMLMISGAFGAPSALQTDFPRLVGVSYIKEPALRLLDPVLGIAFGIPGTLPGARYEVVHST